MRRRQYERHILIERRDDLRVADNSRSERHDVVRELKLSRAHQSVSFEVDGVEQGPWQIEAVAKCIQNR